MPRGFFTIEQWRDKKWVIVCHLDAGHSLTSAMQELERRGKPGLFRVSQMQRCFWAEMKGRKLQLHGAHASSPQSLSGIVEIFEREGGRRPVEKARQQRLAAKRARQG